MRYAKKDIPFFRGPSSKMSPMQRCVGDFFNLFINILQTNLK